MRALSETAGLAAGHVQTIESGAVRCVTTETARALAVALGVSLDWLLTGEGEGPAKVDRDSAPVNASPGNGAK